MVNFSKMTVRGPTVKLSNGVEMPLVGLGTWQSSPDEVKAAVHAAIDAGYRLIDTAACYANEESIGEAIREAITAGKIKREDIFVTTKLWATHISPNYSMQAAKDCLKRLGFDYVDLLLAHEAAAYTPDTNEQDHSCSVEDVWRGFEAIYETKLARAIGVSNWSGEQIERVMKIAKFPIHNNQVEVHLYWPQHELQELSKKHNIVVTSYGSLGSPGRVHFRLPGAEVNWEPSPCPLDDERVSVAAKKHNKTPAQILLRYCLDRGMAVIPKSVKAERVKENFNLFDFHLNEEEIKELETAPHRQRLFLHDFMAGHPEDAFKNERK